MRLFYVICGLIVVLGAGLSVLLIPRENELGLIYLKHGEHQKAIEIYEKQIASGDISVSVVHPAVDVYLHTGRVEDAIHLLERFVKTKPRNLMALNRLAELYRDAFRPYDQIRTLEKVVAIEPNLDALRLIEGYYRRNALWEDWARTTRALIAAFPDDPKDFQRLARYEASMGRKARAIQIMQQLESFHFEHMTAGNLELMLSLLTDVGRRDAAFEQAQFWLEKLGDAKSALRIAKVFQHRKDLDLALKLMRPFAAASVKYPDLLENLTWLEVELGQRAVALERLKKFRAAGTLPKSLQPLLIQTALAERDIALALEVAGTTNAGALSDQQILALVSETAGSARRDFARTIMRRLGAERLAEYPVLAARLALAAGDRADAERRVAAAEALPELPFEQLVALASVYERLGRSAEAVAMLEKAVAANEAAGDDLMRLAVLYIEVRRVEDGKALFGRLRTERAGPWVNGAWAMLTAAGGDDAGAAAFVSAAPADGLNPEVLKVLFARAQKLGSKALALATADRLYKLDPSDPGNRLALARARTANGQGDEALPILKAMLPGSSEVQTAYLAALAAVAKAGSVPEKELQAAFRERVQDPNLSERGRTDLIYAMIEAGAYGMVLPELKRLVERDGGDWIYAYETALRKLGRTGELRTFWTQQLARPSVDDETRRAIGYRMLEAGDKTAAAGVFRKLAEGRPPTSPDLAQLIDIWGPDAKPEEIAWIEARALADSGASRAKWFEHLISLGAVRRVIALAEKDPAQLREGPVVAVYLDALRRTKQKGRIGKLVGRQIANARDAATLRPLARAAFDESNYGAAARAYRAILKSRPGDQEALRRLGHMAYYGDRCGDAKPLLARYFQAGGGDFESYYYMGECLTRGQNWRAATPYYERALAATGGGGFQKRLIRANVLYRLGRFEESVSAFERLLKVQPRNRYLREDYIAVLSALGRYDRARQLSP